MLASAAWKKFGRRLAEQNRLTLRGIFQRRHEGAGVEAQFAVLVLEAAIAREREERGACEQLAEGLVERGIGEAISGVTDHHSLGSRGRQVREVLLQSWMDQQVRPTALSQRATRAPLAPA